MRVKTDSVVLTNKGVGFSTTCFSISYIESTSETSFHLLNKHKETNHFLKYEPNLKTLLIYEDLVVSEHPPRFGWVIPNRVNRVIPPGLLGDVKSRAKFIRSVFAFPFGHTFALEDAELDVDDRDRVLVEWEMFQGLSIAFR